MVFPQIPLVPYAGHGYVLAHCDCMLRSHTGRGAGNCYSIYYYGTPKGAAGFCFG